MSFEYWQRTSMDAERFREFEKIVYDLFVSYTMGAEGFDAEIRKVFEMVLPDKTITPIKNRAIIVDRE